MPLRGLTQADPFTYLTGKSVRITRATCEGGLIYLTKAVDGGFGAYEDGFTLLELCRKYYREADLDMRELDALIR